jgi:hypothetical protein
MSLELGSDSNILFEVFGDESTNGEIVAFGVAIAPIKNIGEISERVRQVKRIFGAENARIHCKELLHGDRRKRSPWSHLSQHDAFNLLESVTRSSYVAGMRAWIGFLDSRSTPTQMVFEGDGKITIMKVTDLHLMLFAYWTAMGPVFDFLPHQRTRGWMDPNRSRVRLLDQNKQIRLAQAFFPIHHNEIRFEPSPIDGEKPMLLDLADIIVHCAARALSTTISPKGKEQYEAILQAVYPGLSVAHFNVAQGPVLSIEAKTTAISVFRDYFRTFQNEV